MDIKELYKLYLQHPSIKTDTRKLKEGDLFFALKGPNFNGNHFAIQALNAGAAYVIADENLSFSDDRIIRIPDVLLTLQQLAKHHREQFNNIPFVAITGSNGKTTTKELVHQVLSASYKTYTTEGNLNNHIGIPLTILKIKKDAEMAVIEMGANHQKEIEGYCSYAMPTHGLITNCGKAHLEGFGSEEGVRKGKGELFEFLKEHNGIAFVNGDDNYIKEMSTGIKNIITYGTLQGFITGRAVSNSSLLEVEVIKGTDISSIKTQLVGQYNLLNVLAAVAIGKHFNIADEKIKAAIENYTPSNSRSQLITMGTNKIILDAYNANPASMKAAIENFAQMPGTNKILLIGSMMELGNESKKEHEALIRLIEKYKWSNVILVGNNFKNIRHSYFYFDDASKAKAWLNNQQLQNSQILIKGSRSMEMEKILETNSRLHTTQ
ncbi:MAG: UDP-N-acetylmuramoyl-tripeptide--D-alanyl-D-alanine ligase [Chitinophagaceae bacterium]|nr:UDP-N-acetylmuramoyl-tripeptide--D-alanyl-D-alanine ligase [Chitinophagaceae bacterium]